LEKIKESMESELGRIADALEVTDIFSLNKGERMSARMSVSEIELAVQNHANSKEMMYDIEAAIQRIDNGTYGICSKCGKMVDEDRLIARPYVSMCIDCQRANGIRLSRGNR
jgi:RNA polymerase-binding protein DksA